MDGGAPAWLGPKPWATMTSVCPLHPCPVVQQELSALLPEHTRGPPTARDLGTEPGATPQPPLTPIAASAVPFSLC